MLRFGNLVMVCSCCISLAAAFQVYFALDNLGTQFAPIDKNAIHLTDVAAQTRINCAFQCSIYPQCRTFNFDTTTQICQLFQGDTIATGSTVAGAQTSVIGSLKLTETLYNAYNKSCDQCSDNRFLRCVNNTCQCEQNTYWNGSFCLPQLPLPCMVCEQNKSMCREDLNLTCQSYNKCDYPNRTCDITEAPTTEATTEEYSTSTPSIGSWIVTGNMSTRRSSHISLLLSSENDTVLLAGGSLSTIIDKFSLASQSFANYSNLLFSRADLTAIEILQSGDILFIGGYSLSNIQNISSFAELLNHTSRTITTTISMTYTWSRHTMIFLPTLSKWLIVGGDDQRCEIELFDPSTLTFSSMNHTGRANRTAVTAALITPNGSSSDIILITGGEDSTNSIVFSLAELFNASSGQSITLPNNMTTARYLHTATPIPYLGKVLLCGGFDYNYAPLNTCEIYDHTSGNFSVTNNAMSTQRYYHTATFLGNGNILIAGGTLDGFNGLPNTELYNPMTNTFFAGAPLNIGRFQHTATLLPKSNKVLVCGGWQTTSVEIGSCELFSP